MTPIEPVSSLTLADIKVCLLNVLAAIAEVRALIEDDDHTDDEEWFPATQPDDGE